MAHDYLVESFAGEEIVSQTFQGIYSTLHAIGGVGFDGQLAVDDSFFADVVSDHHSALVNYLETYVQSEVAGRLVKAMVGKVNSGEWRFHNSNEKRFRVLIKTTLDRSILNHFQLESVSAKQKMAASSGGLFIEFWRESVLREAWSLMKQLEGVNGFPLLVCRLRIEHPLITNDQLMRRVGQQHAVGDPADFRMQMRAAHQVFLHALFGATQRTLKTPSPKTIYQEMVDLRLDQLI